MFIPLSLHADNLKSSIGPIPYVEERSGDKFGTYLFHDALRKFKRGSAPGLSGLTFEHLVSVLRSQQHFSALTRFLNRCLQGGICHDVAQTFRASKLIALRKDSNGGLRPIAVGETLRRLVGKCVCLELRSRFKHHFYPRQSGMAVQGGIEMVTHAVESIMDNPLECEAVLAIELSNAFNEVAREPIFRSQAPIFRSSCPSLPPCMQALRLSGCVGQITSTSSGLPQAFNRETP